MGGLTGPAAEISIGNVVSGGTPGSVLFVGAGGVLAEDNANLFYVQGANPTLHINRLDLARGLVPDPAIAAAFRFPPDTAGANAFLLNFVGTPPTVGQPGSNILAAIFGGMNISPLAANYANVNILWTNAPALGAGVTVTNYTVLQAILGGAGITNNYGLRIFDNLGATNTYGIESQVNSRANAFNLHISGTADNALGGPLYLAKETKAIQANSAMFAGNGVPNNANGNDGDFYMRGDGAAGTFIYHKAAGVWTAFA